MKEISIEELFSLSEDSYTLIDIRDEAQVQYGMIPGAVHISLDKLEEEVNTEIRAVFKAKKLVFYDYKQSTTSIGAAAPHGRG